MAMSTATVTHPVLAKDRVRPWVDSQLLIRIALGTLVAAILDAGFAFVTYVLIAHRYNFETLLQYIATGIDHHAFRVGWSGVGTAALGFAIHLGLSLGFAVAYVAGLRNAQKGAAGIVALGVVYGAVIWVIMAGTVLPGLGVMHEPAGGRYWWAFLLDHAVLVGLPIAGIGSFRSTFGKRR